VLGEPHAEDCACRSRTVVVRAIIEYTVSVPADQTPESIGFCRNESSWCASNLLDEIDAIDSVKGNCLRQFTRFEYVREASTEDEEASFGAAGRLEPPEIDEEEISL